jgi:hypothetical protein
LFEKHTFMCKIQVHEQLLYINEAALTQFTTGHTVHNIFTMLFEYENPAMSFLMCTPSKSIFQMKFVS